MRGLYLCVLLLSTVLSRGHANVASVQATWLDEIHASTVPQDDDIGTQRLTGGTDAQDPEQAFSNSSNAETSAHGRALQTTTITATYCSYPAVRSRPVCANV